MKYLKLFEFFSSEKTLICVDIQPEYKDYIYFSLRDFGEFIKKLLLLHAGFTTKDMLTLDIV